MARLIKIACFFIAMGTTFTVFSQEELMYNAFLEDSVGVGENADLFVTVEEGVYESIASIDLSVLENMKFFSASASPTDSIVSKKGDVSINSLGLWKDENKDGILTGEEIKWERLENNGEVIFRNKINISFFDVGIYVFEGFEFASGGKSSKTNRALMKTTFIDYKLEVVDSTGLAPIKDIEKTSLSVLDLIPFLLYILLPALLIFLAYRYWKSRKTNEVEDEKEEEIVIPPDVKALSELKDLRQRELWQKGEIKQYQSELSHIIREYLEGRYDIKALENTTRQIVRSIKDKSFTSEDERKLTRILQISDLVKFAKAKPELSIHEEFMNDAVGFVQTTRKVETLKEEEE